MEGVCHMTADVDQAKINWRKAMSHVFGRNKNCTRSIPDRVWPWFCRKHYQRGRYRNGHDYAKKQVWAVTVQVLRLEAWSNLARVRHEPDFPDVEILPSITGEREKPKTNWVKPRTRPEWVCRKHFPLPAVGVSRTLPSVWQWVCRKHYPSGSGPNAPSASGSTRRRRRNLEDEEEEEEEDEEEEDEAASYGVRHRGGRIGRFGDHPNYGYGNTSNPAQGA
jgi:hypothetical protein